MAVVKKRADQDPLVIIGNWTVHYVKVRVGESIGIEPEVSKFKIRFDRNDYLLEERKYAGEKPSFPEWKNSGGKGSPIKLSTADSASTKRAPILDALNYLLWAEIELEGDPHLLALGTDDGGTTLNILVAGNPGGYGSAGRP